MFKPTQFPQASTSVHTDSLADNTIFFFHPGSFKLPWHQWHCDDACYGTWKVSFVCVVAVNLKQFQQIQREHCHVALVAKRWDGSICLVWVVMISHACIVVLTPAMKKRRTRKRGMVCIISSCRLRSSSVFVSYFSPVFCNPFHSSLKMYIFQWLCTNPNPQIKLRIWSFFIPIQKKSLKEKRQPCCR